MREQILKDDPTIITGPVLEKLPKMLKTDLFKTLYNMPKPACHHIHLTASVNINFMVKKLCYYDFVYYNEKD